MTTPSSTTLWCRPAGATATKIVLGTGLLDDLRALLDDAERAAPSGRYWLWDQTLQGLLSNDIMGRDAAGSPAGAAAAGHAVASGESLKTLAQVETTLRRMAQAGLDRRAELVAVGGGSVGDHAGLAASLYLRGIPIVHVPTTLLAMIDSSVGGKTAVNLPEGKNLVGSVHPPRLVVADMEVLGSLPDHEFRSGLGEALKMAIGLDAELFEFLSDRREAILGRDRTALLHVVSRCVQAKIDVVEGDLHESGPRRVLNLGHTWGHALEIHADFAIPHGVAVARGIHVVLDLAAERGALSAADRDRAAKLLTEYGFPAHPIPSYAELAPYLRRDKKVRDGALHVVLPTGIGRCTVAPIPLTEFR